MASLNHIRAGIAWFWLTTPLMIAGCQMVPIGGSTYPFYSYSYYALPQYNPYSSQYYYGFCNAQYYPSDLQENSHALPQSAYQDRVLVSPPPPSALQSPSDAQSSVGRDIMVGAAGNAVGAAVYDGGKALIKRGSAATGVGAASTAGRAAAGARNVITAAEAGAAARGLLRVVPKVGWGFLIYMLLPLTFDECNGQSGCRSWQGQ